MGDKDRNSWLISCLAELILFKNPFLKAARRWREGGETHYLFISSKIFVLKKLSSRSISTEIECWRRWRERERTFPEDSSLWRIFINLPGGRKKCLFIWQGGCEGGSSSALNVVRQAFFAPPCSVFAVPKRLFIKLFEGFRARQIAPNDISLKKVFFSFLFCLCCFSMVFFSPLCLSSGLTKKWFSFFLSFSSCSQALIFKPLNASQK